MARRGELQCLLEVRGGTERGRVGGWQSGEAAGEAIDDAAARWAATVNGHG
jgi:hypothetical protein